VPKIYEPCVIDTNMLIYYLNQQLPEAVKVKFDNSILAASAISIITRIEVLGWQGHSEQSMLAARTLLSLLKKSSALHDDWLVCRVSSQTHQAQEDLDEIINETEADFSEFRLHNWQSSE
jgi:hypothetical protein